MDEFWAQAADAAGTVFYTAAVVCYAAALLGCVYALVAAWVVRSFTRSATTAPATNYPAVTILKPLHGLEPNLYANLAELLRSGLSERRCRSCSALPIPPIRQSGSCTNLMADFPDTAI